VETGVIRAVPDRRPEFSDGVVHFPFLKQDDPESATGAGIPRIDPERLPEVDGRPVSVPPLLQGVPKARVCVTDEGGAAVGGEIDGLLEADQGLVCIRLVPRALLQSVPEPQMAAGVIR
jgi:hypothetical protein